MNLLAYQFYNGAGPVGILINIIIWLAILAIFYWIVTKILAAAGAPPFATLVLHVIIAIMAILFLASLLTGCGLSASYTDKTGATYSGSYTAAPSDGKTMLPVRQNSAGDSGRYNGAPSAPVVKKSSWWPW